MWFAQFIDSIDTECAHLQTPTWFSETITSLALNKLINFQNVFCLKKSPKCKKILPFFCHLISFSLTWIEAKRFYRKLNLSYLFLFVKIFTSTKVLQEAFKTLGQKVVWSSFKAFLPEVIFSRPSSQKTIPIGFIEKIKERKKNSIDLHSSCLGSETVQLFK